MLLVFGGACNHSSCCLCSFFLCFWHPSCFITVNQWYIPAGSYDDIQTTCNFILFFLAVLPFFAAFTRGTSHLNTLMSWPVLHLNIEQKKKEKRRLIDKNNKEIVAFTWICRRFIFHFPFSFLHRFIIAANVILCLWKH